jgi:hypothetical protein
MSIHVVSVIEGKTRVKPSGLSRVFRISLRQLLVLILAIVVASASFVWASDRIETHKRWASMLETSQRFGIVFDEVYFRLPSIAQNVTTDPTHYWFIDELDDALWTIHQLIKLDSGHASELFKIGDLILTLRDSGATGVQLNGSQFENLSNITYTIAQGLLHAYWNPLNTTEVNSETGPPFWYFGPSPPDEALLQHIATLAIQAKEIIKPSA